MEAPVTSRKPSISASIFRPRVWQINNNQAYQYPESLSLLYTERSLLKTPTVTASMVPRELWTPLKPPNITDN